MTSASWPELSPDGVTAPDLAYSVAGSADALRHVMGHFASGVTIATALYHGIKPRYDSHGGVLCISGPTSRPGLRQ